MRGERHKKLAVIKSIKTGNCKSKDNKAQVYRLGLISTALFGERTFMDLYHVISLLGGVAFFLFGMETMGGGLKNLAGNKMEAILWRLSSSPVKGFLLGIFATAVIQSSGATSVMVVSFVSAGMMTLTQAVPIILGSNIGTTMTGWILTLSDSSGALSQVLSSEMLVAVLAIIGAILWMFTRKNSSKSVGMVLLGLGTLLLSMSLISASVDPLKQSEQFRQLLILFENPLLGILAGTVVAAIIQSCSAGVGIMQALCVSVVLPYSVVLPVIIGINIGASSPILISMIGGNRNSKRTSLVYLIANTINAVIVYSILAPLQLLVDIPILDQASTSFGIALVNTGLNAVCMLIMLPFHKVIEKICYLIIRPDPSENEDLSEIDSLDESLLNYAPAALEVSKKAALKMCEISRKNLFRAIKLIREFDRSKYQKVQEKETLCDKYEDKLGNYIVKIGKNGLDDKQQALSSELLSVIGDFERLSDHAANISETAIEINDKKITFSDEANHEIDLLIQAAGEILTLSTAAFTERRRDLALRVEPLEETIDEMIRIVKSNHIDRVSANNCTIVTGFVYSDLLTNIERVADHCSNIAFSVLHSYDINAEGHMYTAHAADSAEFKNSFSEYTEKYIEPVKRQAV